MVIFRWSESDRGRGMCDNLSKLRKKECFSILNRLKFNISQREINWWRRSDQRYQCQMAITGLLTMTSVGTNQPTPKCLLQKIKSFKPNKCDIITQMCSDVCTKALKNTLFKPHIIVFWSFIITQLTQEHNAACGLLFSVLLWGVRIVQHGHMVLLAG